jgi:hypothetical protein
MVLAAQVSIRGMSDMPRELDPVLDNEPVSSGASAPSAPRRAITVDVDSKLDERLRWIAWSEKTSEEGLLTRIIESQPKHSGQRRLTVAVTEAAAESMAAAAATIGMSEEELIAEAIDTYSPRMPARAWLGLGLPGLLLILPLALMFLSPRIGSGAPALARVIFGLSSQVPASFNLPMARIDAIYFTLGTFTTTGTGRFVAQSAGAELMVTCQVVFGWAFVAILVALLVPRATAAYKRQSTNGRIIVRIGKPDQ